MFADFPHTSRPRFSSPEDWLDHVDECRKAGRHPWPPASRDELLLADKVGLLENHPEWIPGRQGLDLLGLPRWFGRQLQPRSLRWRVRDLETLSADGEYRQAVRRLIMGEVSQ